VRPIAHCYAEHYRLALPRISKPEVLDALKESLRALEGVKVNPEELHIVELKDSIRNKISELEAAADIPTAKRP
jgi:hypothetical protein